MRNLLTLTGSGKRHLKSLARTKKQEALIGVLFASPAIFGFLLFIFIPMIASLGMSFTDYALVNKMRFIGLENYVKLLNGTDPFFYKALGVTTYYVLLSTPLCLIFAFFMAVLLNNESIRGKAIFRTIFYLPTLIPVVASSMIWLWLFNPDLGLINTILRVLHLPPGMWIYDEKTVIPSIVLMSLWTSGGTMIIFLAGLQGIPKQLYESVELDGGKSVHKLFYITIPLMTPTIFFNLVIGFIYGFQVFTQAYIMTEGGPNNASLFYTFYLYRTAFKFSKMANACAIGWILFIIIALLTLLIFKTSKEWVHTEGGR
ncbi:MAG: sugar ABC transporter permease [Spirochaetales bacterium]|jgi:multiple sugar transport system permease protein|nr:sugar ABC transporter permease [Spirochaetales bacterium]